MTEVEFLDLVTDFVAARIAARKNNYLDLRYIELNDAISKLDSSSWFDRLQDRLEWDLINGADVQGSRLELSIYYHEKVAKNHL